MEWKYKSAHSIFHEFICLFLVDTYRLFSYLIQCACFHSHNFVAAAADADAVFTLMMLCCFYHFLSFFFHFLALHIHTLTTGSRHIFFCAFLLIYISTSWEASANEHVEVSRSAFKYCIKACFDFVVVATETPVQSHQCHYDHFIQSTLSLSLPLCTHSVCLCEWICAWFTRIASNSPESQPQFSVLIKIQAQK